MNSKNIEIRGAKQHNLKNISLKIPKNKLVVFTGVSGSGKSSLAFDTIFAEGQRRYVESLSAYARQFLGQLDKPDVEFISGLSPSISIDQKSTSRNPRSTVGTVTEIYDYLRLLYARIGIPHCPECYKEILPQTIDQIVDQVLKLEDGSKLQILSPVVRGRKGEYQKLFKQIKLDGFSRVRVDGEVHSLEEPIDLDKNLKHNIDIIVDRIKLKDGIRSRLADSISTALKCSEGLVTIEIIGDREIIFSELLACSTCGISYDELSPRMFSFNSPYGACASCSGIGAYMEIDPGLVIPDDTKSLSEKAIYPWAKTGNSYYVDLIHSVALHYGIDMNTPFKDINDIQKKIILYGSDGEKISLEHDSFKGHYRQTYEAKFEGVIPNLKRRFNSSNSDLVRGEIEKYMTYLPCETCKGTRLKPVSLAVTVGNLSISQLCALSVSEAFEFIEKLSDKLNDYQNKIAHQLLIEIKARLKFLINVGLTYLALDRPAGTLSGGEAQRIRLATQIGSGLSGVLYVLDEPSIGLHQINNRQLLSTLTSLRDLGNTLIVVEHDEETIRSADWIIDIGPGAGLHGGDIVAEGPQQNIISNKNSITGKYLSGEKKILIPKIRRNGSPKKLVIKNARKNNLKNLNVEIPLGKFVAVTGVSGSGKSTLLFDLLHPFVKHYLGRNVPKPKDVDSLEGIEYIDKVIDIDQSPIGRTPRSNPATYTGVFDHIRETFSLTQEAKLRGYKPGRFSFNVKGGRCEACQGEGTIKIEMNFLPDVYIPCEVCKGKRYNRETLEVKYKAKSIFDVLEMSVEEALEFFENIPRIKNKLQTLNDVGLNYIKLGQSAPTLSGGEAQRVKLAAELLKRNTGNTLYVLDEPSVGLHWEDLQKLLIILNRFVDSGNTVVIIEHNLDIIKVADWVIDLGPEGG
ncbi:MAG: excinuclease ABC subunit UvrA, partial [Cyanobacteriota bacterium]